VLELQEVLKHYRGPGEVVRAVDGVSLTLAPGEIVAIHGPSGSGKTTMLLLMAGLLTPDQGKIYFRGIDLSGMTQREIADFRRHEVGFVFQNFNLMPGMTALENVALALMLQGKTMGAARDQCMRMLKRVGLANRFRHTPLLLSAGERQRVAIARALVGSPSLILADEPTGNLDSHRSAEVLELLSRLARERSATVVLMTHDTQASRYANRVLELRDGRLADDGQKRTTRDAEYVAEDTRGRSL
jgi:putative ABC transport system ATP-binding protein